MLAGGSNLRMPAINEIIQVKSTKKPTFQTVGFFVESCIVSGRPVTCRPGCFL